MGTWGQGILDDDLAGDVYSSYLQRFDAGEAREAIATAMQVEYSDEIADSDDGPIFWFALAKAVWDTGTLDANLRTRVQELIRSGAGLERWADQGPGELAKRKKALEAFATRLAADNPKPRKGKNPVFRTAPFRPGQCLSLALSDGDFGAAIVLAEDSGLDAPGSNLVAVLDYKSASPPQQETFEKREWLRLTHHKHEGRLWALWCFPFRFKKISSQFLPVAVTSIRRDDPINCQSYGGWELLAPQVALERDWRAAHAR